MTRAQWALFAVCGAPSRLLRGGGPPNRRCVAEGGRRTDTWSRSGPPRGSSVSGGVRTVRFWRGGAPHSAMGRGVGRSAPVCGGDRRTVPVWGGGAVRRPLGPDLGRRTGALGSGYALSQSIYGVSARHAVVRSMALNRTAQPSRLDVTPILFPPITRRATRPLFHLPSSPRPLMSSSCHLHHSLPVPPVLPDSLARV